MNGWNFLLANLQPGQAGVCLNSCLDNRSRVMGDERIYLSSLFSPFRAMTSNTLRRLDVYLWKIVRITVDEATGNARNIIEPFILNRQVGLLKIKC